MKNNQTIAFISDEFSANLDEAIKCAKSHQLSLIELRSINKINLLNLSLKEIREIAKKIHDSGLIVASFASPLLKWNPDGSSKHTAKVNTHGYQQKDGENYDLLEKAFVIAEILQTKYIRIFSYLKYAGFRYSDLDGDLAKLIQLAEKYNKILLLENEPACNIDTLSSQFELISAWDHPRLRVLLDIGNIYQMGEQLLYADLDRLAPYISYAHIKDFDITKSTYVTVGEGSINYKRHLTTLKDALQDRKIVFSLETHVKSNSQEATNSSIKYLKKVLTTNRRVRYGIVGCGNIAKRHARSIVKDLNSELVGVFDIEVSKTKKFQGEWDTVAYADQYSLSKDVDVLCICTPHDIRANIIAVGLTENCFVLCEKPLYIKQSDFDSIVNLPNHQEKVTCVFQNRFNEAVQELYEQFIPDGWQDIKYISGRVCWPRDEQYYSANSWKGKIASEGGILYNQGIHMLDIILSLFPHDTSISVLSAIKRKIFHKDIETEDSIVCQLLVNQALVSLEITTANIPVKPETYLLVASPKKSVKLGGYALNKVEEKVGNREASEELKNTPKFALNSGNCCGHESVIYYMSQYVETGNKNILLGDFSSAVRVNKLIEEIYQKSKDC
ncbi:TIM barrel protein [Moorena sp. SIO3H5]|uniref:TIM barrel protein n=1 Tax=Moorena sp. SIO3H5 TaxID=2607834 RepID=UPI0013B7BE9E|nr:TIM barrel protein [Moorena sp. SIO3H5]NEO70404.1 TIM barrel protein [Moorena sp. SIO3H5]